MTEGTELRLEAATGLSLGAREAQEDAVLCDVPQGGAAGIVVLADGLGGHSGGALASRITVTTVLRELASHRGADGALQGEIPALLRIAAQAANHALLAQAEDTPEVTGMGSTLVVAVVQEGNLYWISVGDSPLYVLRGGEIRQLNETHSLATHLDLLVRVGEMAPEVAAAHPGRSCLTSALGSETIDRIDCPETPFAMCPGDVLLAASDGILTLAPGEIAARIGDAPEASPAELAAHLLEDVAAVQCDGQDNLSVAVLRAEAAAGRIRRASWFRPSFWRSGAAARAAMRAEGAASAPGTREAAGTAGGGAAAAMRALLGGGARRAPAHGAGRDG